MIDKALYETQPGITAERLCDEEVIVSLTTYGKRLYEVAIAIESIMQGSMKPNRIILWLGDDLRGAILPITLKRQQQRGLEIRFCKDIRSYKKLIPTITEHPDAVVVTIDDDAIYHYDMLENMVNTHIQHPAHIIANRIHRAVLDSKGHPVSYLKWIHGYNPREASPLNFFTGVGGVLYPPHSLHAEVINEPVFMNICKYADDVWFYAMALKSGTKAMKAFTHTENGEDHILNESVQDTSLMRINVGPDCANDRQLKAVFDKYGLYGFLTDGKDAL